MATAPEQQLPLFYKELEPLSSQTHADYRIRPTAVAPFVKDTHAIPLTVEEFPMAQRNFPIVFSVGDDPIPLGLMGLNEGINVFFDDEGTLLENSFYVPAYVRRYPYLLARLRPDSDELSLCFDPTTDLVGPGGDGDKLFDDGQPSEATKAILAFNEQFEQAGQRTALFIKDLKDMELLIDGEVTIQPDGAAQPFVYRGFMIVDENKLNELRGDQLRKIVQNGMLPLIYAHLFSLSQMREVFGRQMQQGKVPAPQLVS
jgi:hypothetical protein